MITNLKILDEMCDQEMDISIWTDVERCLIYAGDGSVSMNVRTHAVRKAMDSTNYHSILLIVNKDDFEKVKIQLENK